MVADGLTRIFKLYYEKLPAKYQVLLQENSTQRIFCIEDEEVEDDIPGVSDEEGNEIVALGAQDDESEVQRRYMGRVKVNGSYVRYINLPPTHVTVS